MILIVNSMPRMGLLGWYLRANALQTEAVRGLLRELSSLRLEVPATTTVQGYRRQCFLSVGGLRSSRQ